MYLFAALLLMFVTAVRAQPSAPQFSAEGVQPTPLAPAMLVSIYGAHLGPSTDCTGVADPRRTETPSALRPDQGFVNVQIFPQELCGVQVMFGDIPAGLLYVQERQINFKVPQEAPVEGSVSLRVLYQGRTGAATLALGLAPVRLSLEEPAYVGGPVWLRVQPPAFPQFGDVRYPFEVFPGYFGCNEVEVRRGGVLLPRIQTRPVGGVGGGFLCGSIGVAGEEIPHKNRLPLHLQYRFDQAGVYEVRFKRFSGRQGALAVYQSEWTPIDILPARPWMPPAPPKNAAEAISDYLPAILGFPDDAHLQLLAGYLYHPNETVRRFAYTGLVYWTEEKVHPRLIELLHSRGPSDVMVEAVLKSPDAIDFILPHLRSSDPVLLRGAILGASRLLATDARARIETALLSSAENVLRVGDPQTVVNFASALGGARDPRAHEMLWNFANRNVAVEQSLMAITWYKDLADLPRLSALLEAPAIGDPKQTTYALLPYAIHNAYGEAAIPALELALEKSGYVFVQTNCARELVLAGRKSGFAFIARSIEQNQFYRAEMVRFVQERFPDLRVAGDQEVLAFLKSRQ